MDIYQYSSFKVSIIDNNIVELVIFNNTEFDISMVNDFHELVKNKMNSRAFVLVNKIYSYSYTFEALLALSRSTSIRSVAVLSNKSIVSSTVSYLAQCFNFYKVPVSVFHEREGALLWLLSIRDYGFNE